MDGLWARKSEGVGLIVRAISFQDFQPMWSWSTNVTDRQTDGRTDDMQSQCRALHHSASRGKNGNSLQSTCRYVPSLRWYMREWIYGVFLAYIHVGLLWKSITYR